MLVHLAVLALTILALSRLHPGVHIRSAGTAVVVAVVFSVLNLLIGWLVGGLVKGLLFVPAVLSFGLLFLFVPFIVNGVLLWLTDKLMASFEIRTLRALLVCAAVITLVNGLFHAQFFHAALSGLGGASGHPRWI
ncbi:MAG TPA: phage holin family protein [Polyangiaceae bacterium]|nr:phage holin family protein [Polyangiaceae bacterium]